jgi:hypothetical protein
MCCWTGRSSPRAGQPARPAVERALASQTGPGGKWGAAQAATSLTIANLLVAGAADTTSASRALELAVAADNPSLIAYAAAAHAATMIPTDPQGAVAQLEEAHRLADHVSNGWLLNVVVLGGLADARAAVGRLDDALVAYLDAAERTHATGWTIHAWTPAWSAAAILSRLGRREQAALMLGGCEASGAARFSQQPVSPELEALNAGRGDPHLLKLRSIGTTLSLPELIRIARGELEPRLSTIRNAAGVDSDSA